MLEHGYRGPSPVPALEQSDSKVPRHDHSGNTSQLAIIQSLNLMSPRPIALSHVKIGHRCESFPMVMIKFMAELSEWAIKGMLIFAVGFKSVLRWQSARLTTLRGRWIE